MRIPRNSIEIMEYVVSEEDSPRFLLEKGIGVLSTPRMIELMESTAKRLIDKYIDTGKYTSVGVHIDVYHKAPAPIGSKVLIKATVLDAKNNRVVFKVECLMDNIVIGEGIHERAIVSWNRFINHVKNIYKH